MLLDFLFSNNNGIIKNITSNVQTITLKCYGITHKHTRTHTHIIQSVITDLLQKHNIVSLVTYFFRNPRECIVMRALIKKKGIKSKVNVIFINTD